MFDPHQVARPQFGGAEPSIHDEIRRVEAAVHQQPAAVRPDHDQRKTLALPDADGEPDMDLLPVVGNAQRLPRWIAATDCVAEAELLQRQLACDRRGGMHMIGAALLCERNGEWQASGTDICCVERIRPDRPGRRSPQALGITLKAA